MESFCKRWLGMITMPLWAPVVVLAYWIVHVFESVKGNDHDYRYHEYDEC